MNKEAYIIQNGYDRVPFTLSENVEVGDIIQFGTEMIAIAGTSGLEGETITVYLSDIVIESLAATDKEIKVGDKLYWNHVDRVLTTDTDDGNGTNYNPAGHAITAKAKDVAGSVRITLNK